MRLDSWRVFMVRDVKADCEVYFGEEFNISLEVIGIVLENTFPCEVSSIVMLSCASSIPLPRSSERAYPTCACACAKLCGSMRKALRQL